MTQEEKRAYRLKIPLLQTAGLGKLRDQETAKFATIPPELANCVADYAERLLEQTMSKQRVSGRYPVDTISGDAS